MNKEIIQFIWKEDRTKLPNLVKINGENTLAFQRKKVGVMLAINKESSDFVNIGYSSCRIGDKFDSEIGLKIARGRALKDRILVKRKHLKHIQSFIERVKKYYQNKTIVTKVVEFK